MCRKCFRKVVLNVQKILQESSTKMSRKFFRKVCPILQKEWCPIVIFPVFRKSSFHMLNNSYTNTFAGNMPIAPVQVSDNWS